MKIIDYRIFGDHTREELEKQVRLFLEEEEDNGWIPYGGVTIHGVHDRINCFCQVMVKVKLSWLEKIFFF